MLNIIGFFVRLFGSSPSWLFIKSLIFSNLWQRQFYRFSFFIETFRKKVGNLSAIASKTSTLYAIPLYEPSYFRISSLPTFESTDPRVHYPKNQLTVRGTRRLTASAAQPPLHHGQGPPSSCCISHQQQHGLSPAVERTITTLGGFKCVLLKNSPDVVQSLPFPVSAPTRLSFPVSPSVFVYQL